MAVRVTQAQLDALRKVSERWQEITQHQIIPEEIDIVTEEEYGHHYHGVWVGTPANDKPGSMFLGIEPDGYTHS
jgi:hypothetical protein